MRSCLTLARSSATSQVYRGGWAEGDTLEACRDELQEVLEDWIILGLRMGHPLPVIDGIDLNTRKGAAQLPPFGPIGRRDLIRNLRRLGFEGPSSAPSTSS